MCSADALLSVRRKVRAFKNPQWPHNWDNAHARLEFDDRSRCKHACTLLGCNFHAGPQTRCSEPLVSPKKQVDACLLQPLLQHSWCAPAARNLRCRCQRAS